jgi:hypothetical protein
VRAGAELVSVTDVTGGVQTVTRVSIEVEGTEKPACVIEAISRYVV